MSKKPTLIIDLRPIQCGKVNGVTISSKNWIEAILESNKFKVILWSNSLSKPTIPKEWESLTKHIHTKIPNKLLNLSHIIFKYPKIDKLLKIKADKYFCPDLRPFSLSKSIKSYLYIHDIAFIKRKKDFSLKSRIWYSLLNTKYLFKNSTHILTNSKFSKEELTNTFGERNIKIIRPLLKKSWYKANNTEKKQRYFICISTLQKRKNLDKTILGFIKFNKKEKHKYTLKIIGQHEKTFKRIKTKNTKHIKFLGKVSENKKIDLIKKSSGLAYLSTYEGFGLPILETIKLSRPAIVSVSRPFTELYKNSVVYCDPYDINSIEQGFKKLATVKGKDETNFDYSKDKKKLIDTLLLK